MEDKKPITNDKYVLKEVVTQTDIGIGENGTETVLTNNDILLKIMNDLEILKKALA